MGLRVVPQVWLYPKCRMVKGHQYVRKIWAQTTMPRMCSMSFDDPQLYPEMKRSGLKRPTIEQVRAWNNRPRKRINPRSKAPHKTRRRAQYEDARAEFLKDRYTCAVCHRPDVLEVHHVRGRNGFLLFDTNHFLAVCRLCHISIHANVEESYRLGLMEKR